jgi:hypothetical protein
VAIDIDMEPQYQVPEPGDTPLTASGSSASLNGRSLQQGVMSTPFELEFYPEQPHATGEMTSMMPMSTAGNNIGSTLHLEAENGLLPDFWQMPLLVRADDFHRAISYNADL